MQKLTTAVLRNKENIERGCLSGGLASVTTGSIEPEIVKSGYDGAYLKGGQSPQQTE
jgi:hypothetical protein